MAVRSGQFSEKHHGVLAEGLGCAFWFLFRFFGDQNLEQDSGSIPDSGGIRLENTLMFRLFKRPEP
jgi:hypothetical protein